MKKPDRRKTIKLSTVIISDLTTLRMWIDHVLEESNNYGVIHVDRVQKVVTFTPIVCLHLQEQINLIQD